MSVFTGEIIGQLNLSKKLQKFQKEALAAQSQTVKEIALLIHENAIRSIQENGDGKKEIRYDPTREVNVSRPGDPPNTDTGRLVQSIKFEINDGGMTARVGTNLKYGAYLEFGTTTMAARPWLQPAVSEAAKEVIAIAKRNMNDAIAGVI